MHPASPVIGYACGVFDMFHIGHLNLLQRARANCDHLIVGVTSDALAAQRKGQRPVASEAERMAIIAALRCVDEVVAQTDMDKFRAWERLGYHRLFVGDDWQGHPDWVALEAQLAQVGAQIMYFPYTKAVSSTQLRAYLDRVEAAPLL